MPEPDPPPELTNPLPTASEQRPTPGNVKGAWRNVPSEHSDKAMFRLTLASTVVAIVAAFAAFWSAFEAHQTRVEDARPFIAVEVKSLDSDDLRTRAVTLSTFGKTPAMYVNASCKSMLKVNEAWDWTNVATNANKEYIPYILPDRKETMLCPTENLAAEGFWVVLGLVRYQDIEGRQYQTPFCF